MNAVFATLMGISAVVAFLWLGGRPALLRMEGKV